MRLLWYAATLALIGATGMIRSAGGHGYTAEPPGTEGEKPPALPEAVLKQTKPIFDGKSLDG